MPSICALLYANAWASGRIITLHDSHTKPAIVGILHMSIAMLYIGLVMSVPVAESV